MINIESYFASMHKAIEKVDFSKIEKAIDIIFEKIENNKNIFVCGNGGSALTASHYVTDWNKSYYLKTGKQLKGISLNDNIGLITSIGNDLSYDETFSFQLESLAQKDDLLIVISGSGNSKNIIKAINSAKEIGCFSLAILGYDGGEAIRISDFSVHFPSWDMQICEDFHLSFGHLVMKSICSESIKPLYE